MNCFNEDEWLKLVFLLADTRKWLDDMERDLFEILPVAGKKTLFRKSYHLTVTTLAHILERHYYRINRHPHAGKFHIPVADILQYLREGALLPCRAQAGSFHFIRTMKARQPIGFDKWGRSATVITIITDAGGKIISAYPGTDLETRCHNSSPVTASSPATKNFLSNTNRKDAGRPINTSATS